MDFYRVITSEPDRRGVVRVAPDFRPRDFKDLMVRGGSFYAIWNEETQMWSRDEYDSVRLVDKHVSVFKKELEAQNPQVAYTMMRMDSFSSKVWLEFKSFMRSVSDSFVELDETLTFLDQPIKKSDFSSKRLPYNMAPGDISAWNELLGTLYSTEERHKIEWAIGSIFAGDSKTIQKFLVFYGSPGTGKGTILNLLERLFAGYTAPFEAKSLGQGSNSFATSAFQSNPLVAIEQDGDLSKIEDNTKLNSIVSHEHILINEKNKPAYPMKVNSMLFIGTNTPVKISDAKSGILRRLIDVHPTGNLIPPQKYHGLMDDIGYELGAIADHCLEVYKSSGKNYYSAYRPIQMMVQTDFFYNFVMSAHDIFVEQGGVGGEQAWRLFKEFCTSEQIDSKLPKYRFREELKNYFEHYDQRKIINGESMWNWYSGFDTSKFLQQKAIKEVPLLVKEYDQEVSILDDILRDAPAQIAVQNSSGGYTPKTKWDDNKLRLEDIDTTQLHYVKPPLNHIVIDFDIKDETGEKSRALNLQATKEFPDSYAEYSQSGEGVHVHFLYSGDPTQLKKLYKEDVEIKVFVGNASLRRRFTKCNNLPIATLTGGLPLKEERSVLAPNTITSERGLREMVANNLMKKYHPGTKPSVDFILKILDDAYSSGLEYDLSDMESDIFVFALGSTNQSDRAIEAVTRMKFKSDTIGTAKEDDSDGRVTFFDCEVYPNFFGISWKYEGDANIVRMINPSPQDVEALFKMRLVGFNNRRYDNHILYARSLGYDNRSLYELSQKIINNQNGASFGAAYNLSYADVFDYASKKQGLKKWQIELGIKHQEMDLPWDQDVLEEDIPRIMDYCDNDVVALEEVWNHTAQDLTVRKLLADLSGLTPNHTTQQLTAKIVFGDDKRPVEEFIYSDLSKEFPGYSFEMGKSYYRNEITGEGGYVYSEPGMYDNVALLDVASMHPNSIRNLQLFGPIYTKRFTDLVDARVAIKHGDLAKAREMMNGNLKPYLTDESGESNKALSDALKLVVNTVYGLTSAKFDNKFRDPRNKDNIVAKRGALFMINLKHFVQERGFTVAHIKTDSIKIPNATPEIIEEVAQFGKKYGYDFEHEATYEKFVLVNDAVYVAKDRTEDGVVYYAVGAQFQQPTVYKTLFSKEDIVPEDIMETKSVTKGAIYMDFEKRDKKPDDDLEMENYISEMRFVGKTGQFTPVTPETAGGANLFRVQDNHLYAVAGTKGHYWKESNQFGETDVVDMSFYQNQINAAIEAIQKYGSYEDFVS